MRISTRLISNKDNRPMSSKRNTESREDGSNSRKNHYCLEIKNEYHAVNKEKFLRKKYYK